MYGLENVGRSSLVGRKQILKISRSNSDFLKKRLVCLETFVTSIKVGKNFFKKFLLEYSWFTVSC